MLSGLATAVQQREVRIDEEYEAVAPAIHDDVASVRARLSSLEDLVDRHPLSRGAFRAEREVHDLRLDLTRLEFEESSRLRKIEAELASMRSEAESHLYLGLQSAEAANLEAAREHLRASLAVAQPGWEKRAEVERDLRAIEKELEERSRHAGEGAGTAQERPR
jgi:hypothetical protein